MDGWNRVVEADRAQREAMFAWRAATEPERRLEVLAGQLRGPGGWAALHYLLVWSDDALALLPALVELSISDRYARDVREVVHRIPGVELIPRPAEVVPPLLDRADGDDVHGWTDYRRLAELLDHVGARDELRRLLDRAATSEDIDARELVEDFRDG